MRLTKRDFNFSDFDQILNENSKIAEKKVARNRLIKLPKNIMRLYFAVSETYTVDITGSGTKTVSLNAGIVQLDNLKDHYVFLGDTEITKGSESGYPYYTIDYGTNSVTLNVDSDESRDLEVEYLPSSGSLFLRAEAPQRLTQSRKSEIFSDQFEILHNKDQTVKSADMKPNNKFYLPQNFIIGVYVNSSAAVDYNSELTQVGITYNQTTMKKFKERMYNLYPSIEGKSVGEIAVRSW